MSIERRQPTTETTRLNPSLDVKWFESLAAHPLEDEDLAYVDHVIELGSKTIDGRRSRSSAAIIQARQEFFEDILVWDYKKHPLHDTYVSYREEHPQLMPISTFISSVRAYDERGVDVQDIIRDRGVNSMRQVTEVNIQRRMGYEAPRDYTRSRLLANGLNPELVLAQVPDARSLSPQDIRQRMKDIEQIGHDPVRTVSMIPQILTMSDSSRATLLEELRRSKPETARAKALFMTSVLRYIGSPVPAGAVIAKQPNTIGLSTQKIRSMISILRDVSDRQEYASLPATKLAKLAIMPLDSVFAAVVEHKISPSNAPRPVEVKDIEAMRAGVKPVDRRGYSLDLIKHDYIRRVVGPQAINAYFAYRPLTAKELESHPELADLQEN